MSVRMIQTADCLAAEKVREAGDRGKEAAGQPGTDQPGTGDRPCLVAEDPIADVAQERRNEEANRQRDQHGVQRVATDFCRYRNAGRAMRVAMLSARFLRVLGVPSM